MRTPFTTSRPFQPLALALACLATALTAPLGLPSARAQSEAPDAYLSDVPRPYIPDVTQRSGLVTRFTRPVPRVPQDADRDSFQGTRYQDEHDNWPLKLHPRNSCKDGGMYGRPLSSACTSAIYPFFTGSPADDMGPDCCNGHPATGRWVGNLVHPFKPVGMYYDRGVYTPIYDLDYAVPGPGPFPWSHFFKRPTGG